MITNKPDPSLKTGVSGRVADAGSRLRRQYHFTTALHPRAEARDIRATHHKNKKVIVFGTFDFLHPGHLDLFRQAKKYGSDLYVIVSRDKISAKVKGRNPRNSEQDRLRLVKSLSIVRTAVLGDKIDPMKMVKKIKPDVVCLGYDQKAFVDQLRKNFSRLRILRLKPYKPNIYKSSKMVKL